MRQDLPGNVLQAPTDVIGPIDQPRAQRGTADRDHHHRHDRRRRTNQ
jgi:hypothetical protein